MSSWGKNYSSLLVLHLLTDSASLLALFLPSSSRFPLPSPLPPFAAPFAALKTTYNNL